MSWRGNGPLAVVTVLLVLGAMGLLVWLQLTYEAGRQAAAAMTGVPVAVVALPPVMARIDTVAPPSASTTEPSEVRKTVVAALTDSATATPDSGLTLSAWASTGPAPAPPPLPGSEPAETAEEPAAAAAAEEAPGDGPQQVVQPPAEQKADEQPPAMEAPPQQAVAVQPQEMEPAEQPVERNQSVPPPGTGEGVADSATDQVAQAWRSPADHEPQGAVREAARPKIAIVLSGLGRNKIQTETAIGRLPPEITLAFNPEGRELQTWVDQAREQGHEVLLELPMEPVSFPENDPGPHTLLTSLPHEKNLARLDWALDRFEGYSGVVNYMGSRFTTSHTHLAPIMTVLKDRGLAFLDGRASANSVAAQVAAESGLPVASNDRYIDAEASRAAIAARLAELEEIARADGHAVGVSLSYPVTIEMLAQWAPTLASKGLQLAPLSAVTKTPNAQ